MPTKANLVDVCFLEERTKVLKAPLVWPAQVYRCTSRRGMPVIVMHRSVSGWDQMALAWLMQ